jgi:hypothetical protein
MTVREFNGTSDELVTDIGAAFDMVYGTAAALLKFSTVTAFRDWTMLHTPGSSFVWTPVGLTNFSTFQMFSNGASSNSGISPGTASWKLVVARKASGNVTPRFSVYDYSSATWAHAAGSSPLSDSGSPPGVGGQVRFTYQNVSDFFGGRIAARALWTNSLPWSADAAGDAAIEVSGLKDAATSWLGSNPSAFWLFDQASVATPVEDLSVSGTADQIAISGTTVVTGDDPPGFSFATTTPLNSATETDHAHPATWAKAAGLGPAEETDVAHPMTWAKHLLFGHALETDHAHRMLFASSAFNPVTDPEARIAPNPADAVAGRNNAGATLRPNLAEAAI